MVNIRLKTDQRDALLCNQCEIVWFMDKGTINKGVTLRSVLRDNELDYTINTDPVHGNYENDPVRNDPDIVSSWQGKYIK